MGYFINQRLRTRRGIRETLTYKPDLETRTSNPAFAILGQISALPPDDAIPTTICLTGTQLCQKENTCIPIDKWSEERCDPTFPWYKKRWVKWAGGGIGGLLLLKLMRR